MGLESVADKQTCRKAGSGLADRCPIDRGNGPERDPLGHSKPTTGFQVDDAPLAKDVAGDHEQMDLGTQSYQRLDGLGGPKGGAIPEPNRQIDELGTNQDPSGQPQVAKRPWPSQSVEQIQSWSNGKAHYRRFDSELRREAVVGWRCFGGTLFRQSRASGESQQDEEYRGDLSKHSPPSWR